MENLWRVWQLVQLPGFHRGSAGPRRHWATTLPRVARPQAAPRCRGRGNSRGAFDAVVHPIDEPFVDLSIISKVCACLLWAYCRVSAGWHCAHRLGVTRAETGYCCWINGSAHGGIRRVGHAMAIGAANPDLGVQASTPVRVDAGLLPLVTGQTAFLDDVATVMPVRRQPSGKPPAPSGHAE